MKTKPKKHLAEQLVSPILAPRTAEPAPDYTPPVRLGLTLMLEGEIARLWNDYRTQDFGDLLPSNAQLVHSLIAGALRRWAEKR